MANRLGRFLSIWRRNYIRGMSAFGSIFSTRDAVPLRDHCLSCIHSVLWNMGVYYRVGAQLVSIRMGSMEDMRRMDCDTCRASDDVFCPRR